MNGVMLVNADALRIPLADGSVHCVVTSPPYWGLRRYFGTARWVGGDPNCDHEAARKKTRFDYKLADKQVSNRGSDLRIYASTCPDCGAEHIDGQLGAEAVHDCLGWATGQACGECFVCQMVAVFREVWRVLRDDGTCWINLGDCYTSQPSWGKGDHTSSLDGRKHSEIPFGLKDQLGRHPKGRQPGIKPKDLVGIPWRVALALQADGWYLRSDIIWSKKAPMPESVTDRPTKSHEYVFLLTKNARYFYDADAIREPVTGGTHSRGTKLSPPKEARNTADGNGHKDWTKYTPNPVGSRNKRTVWTIGPDPYPGSHYAVFPRSLVEPCIKAGTSEHGVCSECGAPWERITKTHRTFESGSVRAGNLPAGKNGQHLQGGGETVDIRRGPVTHVSTVDWLPTCDHNADIVPATVLDPFTGSGTTLLVARQLGRNGVGLDLSYAYLHDQARSRLELDRLDAWSAGRHAEPADLAGLPLFGGGE